MVLICYSVNAGFMDKIVLYFRKYGLVIFAGILLLVATVWLFKSPSRGVEAREPNVLVVDAVTVKQAPHDGWMKVHAVVTDHLASAVKSPISATVERLLVREDAVVSKGDVLVILDQRDLERDKQYLIAKESQQLNAIAATKKQLAHQDSLVSQQTTIYQLAQKKYDRYQRLLKEKLVSVQELESFKAESLKHHNQLVREQSQLIALTQRLQADKVVLMDIRNQLQDVLTSLEDCIIKAQWDGWVRGIKVRPGSEVMKNEVVLTVQGHHYDLVAPLSIDRYKKLVNLEGIDASLQVDHADIDLSQGSLVPYKMNKQSHVSWPLPAEQQWVVGDRYDVYIRLPHELATTKLPQKAVFDSYVFEIADGHLRAVPVSIVDVSEKGEVALLVTGLKDNMRIMTTGLAGPKEGLAVKVAE